MEGYRQFIPEGVQHQPETWSNLKGQIYLGTAAFVTEIAAQHKDRKTAIIAAYKTGEYNTARRNRRALSIVPNDRWGYSS